ncbi:ribosome biogenesis GTP-binding protein YihA/YsxC [Arhodomonas sp. AD133]|uniref:ribosome biogenesis GTP-binding protein YihA/YsxC n=1 Tax=Arhodomonas sp. AD133 TaxID=3415009 RepID=UPI003EBCB069
MNPLYHKARFLLSAPDVSHLPPDTGSEVAFAGRSNSGKSSAINALTGQKSLARTSKTPGRTQAINVFPLDESRRLIDLPGYGYAKVPAKMRAHWQRALPEYLAARESLRGLVIIMDVRHPLTDFDRQMLEWCVQAGLPAHVLLTKADKLKRGPGMSTLQRVRSELDRDFPQTSAQLFSAAKGDGIEALHRQLDEWLEESEKQQAESY